MAKGQAQARREQPDPDALIGTEINGRFHIVERIARGGMGKVYYATQAPLNRPVALKVLHVLRDCDAEARENFHRRFLQEASMLARLQHPNIVMLFDYGQITNLPGEHYFMAMEYLRGETLADRFRTRGRLGVTESISIVRQIGRGLREAHRHGFVHRDLKPSNVMVVPEDETNDIVKLVDFGIGKIIRAHSDIPPQEDITQAGLLLGSPRYMSPEQIRSEPIEPRTDLYALGVTLFQALTGRLPFEGRTSVSLMLAHCSLPPPELSAVCPQQFYPPSLTQLVRALLEKQPKNRPTIDEFLQSLAMIEEELFGVATGTLPSLSGAQLRRSLRSSHPKRDVHGPRLAPSISGSSIPAPAASEQPSPVTSSWLGGSEQRMRSFLGSALLPVDGGLPVPGAAAPFVVRSDPTTPTPIPPSLHSRIIKPNSSGYPSWLVLGTAALALLAAGAIVAITFANTGSDRRQVAVASRLPRPSLTAALEAPRPTTPSPEPARPPPPSRFVFTIDSSPERAKVTELGKDLGTTPLTLVIERESVAQAPRRFVLRHEGYQPYILERGDSEAAVHASVALTLESRPMATTAPMRPADAQATNISPHALSSKTTPSSDLDIRPRR